MSSRRAPPLPPGMQQEPPAVIDFGILHDNDFMERRAPANAKVKKWDGAARASSTWDSLRRVSCARWSRYTSTDADSHRTRSSGIAGAIASSICTARDNRNGARLSRFPSRHCCRPTAIPFCSDASLGIGSRSPGLVSMSLMTSSSGTSRTRQDGSTCLSRRPYRRTRMTPFGITSPRATSSLGSSDGPSSASISAPP